MKKRGFKKKSHDAKEHQAQSSFSHEKHRVASAPEWRQSEKTQPLEQSSSSQHQAQSHQESHQKEQNERHQAIQSSSRQQQRPSSVSQWRQPDRIRVLEQSSQSLTTIKKSAWGQPKSTCSTSTNVSEQRLSFFDRPAALEKTMSKSIGRGRGRGQDIYQKQQQSLSALPMTHKSVIESPSGCQQTTTYQKQDAQVQPKSEQTSNIKQTSQAMANLKITESSFAIPKRKNLQQAGTEGKPITVLTNMMDLKFGNKFPSIIYHYDVDIKPEKKKYLYRKVFCVAIKKLFPNNTLNMGFDGKKNAICAKKLNDNLLTTKVIIQDDDEHDNEYSVTLQLVSEYDSQWLKDSNYCGKEITDEKLKCINALNIILKSALSLKSYLSCRSYFTPPKGQVTNIGNGMDLWHGLFQSVNIGWKPFLNVDVSHKGFFKAQPLIELIKIICFENQSRPGSGRFRGRDQRPQARSQDLQLTMQMINDNQESIINTIAGLRVSLYNAFNKKERSRQIIRTLVNKRPSEDFFDVDGKKISVLQHYEQKKNYRIKYPDLPCIMLANNSHVPIEVCEIEPGQTTNKKEIQEKLTKNMIRASASNTTDRQKKILDLYQSAQHNQDPCVKDFDISISGEFKKVPARILLPPAIYYKNDKTAPVIKGTWRTLSFRDTTKIIFEKETWTILNLDERTKMDCIYEFAKILRNEAQKLGMYIGEPKTPFDLNVRPRLSDIEACLRKQKQNGIRFVIVVFPDRIKNTYATIKQVAELKVGILTQCIKSVTLTDKIMNGDMSTISNILQKINAKLNGVNHSFYTLTSRPKCLEVPCMIVGADVTHPSPQMRNCIPSIAAVVASHDPYAQFKYNTEIRFQLPTKDGKQSEEIILDLENIMRKQLLYFSQKNNGQKPQKIIFYRDGVDDGRFKEVLQKELQAIRKACLCFGDNYKPAITFLVVQKRHHTRLFPMRKEDSDDRNFNVKAGTIVDTIITHPSHKDFYLVSHASIQGTARPTKYRCLWDDSNMSEDELENLTYYLCHMFSRCTRSVSYPAPTYYAHLAAFRARNLTEGVPINLDRLDDEQRYKLTLQPDILKTPMFFV